MNPRRKRDTGLVQIAAAVVGSAGAAQVIGPIDPDEPDLNIRQPDGSVINCTTHDMGDCPYHEPEMPLTVEQQLNTYADARNEGVHDDPAGPAYVGANGRRLMLRVTDEGLYIGGVLVTDRGEALELAGRIEQWVAGLAGEQL